MEKFTQEAKKVLDLAENIALKTGSMLESVHILVAITEVSECSGAQILKRLGFAEKEAESYLVTVSDRSTGRVIISPVTRQIISLAAKLAENESVPCDTGHILLSLCYHRSSLAAKILSRHKIDYDLILPIVVSDASKNESEEMLPISSAPTINVEVETELIKFGEFLTKKVRDNKTEPFYGREKEIARLMQVLCRKNKNNPILIGESGVGKTAIVDGLAQKIVSGDVPPFLKNKEIFSLDVSSVVSGTKYRGDLEEKTQQLLKLTENEQIIVFIDEIHTLLNTGNGDQSVNLSSLIKPALTGKLTVIGATTFDEYKKYVEKDVAFERRFTKIVVEEMSPDDTIKLLQNKLPTLERHFDLKISNEAVKASVDLSERFVKDRFFPDKAIDLIEETCAKAAISGQKRITKDDVRQVLADSTGLPVKTLSAEDRERVLQLEKELKKRVKGQDKGLEDVALAIKRTYAGLNEGKRPYSFLFIGPTGVGKTETAKTLAEVLFGAEENLIRFDMSEFSDKNSASKFIGSPPGYVGYEEGGRLTEAVRRQPYCVLLFDDVEKADAEIYDLFLQMLDDGRLTDGKGRTVDFSHAIVIMTSNLGSTKITDKKTVGFIVREEEDRRMERLKEYFAPEFLNRINKIIFFNSLCKEDLVPIANKLVERIKETLKKERNVTLSVRPEVIAFLAEKGYDKEYGARPLRRVVESLVEDEISQVILTGDLKNCSLEITMCGEKPQIRTKEKL